MEVIKRKKVAYKYLGLPHHYTTELQFNNSWYFFDPNMEPKISEEERNVKNWKNKWRACTKSFFSTKYLSRLLWIFPLLIVIYPPKIKA